MTQWKCFIQTHLLFVIIYGLLWSSSVKLKNCMGPLNIRRCWCTPMCHWLRDITLSSNGGNKIHVDFYQCWEKYIHTRPQWASCIHTRSNREDPGLDDKNTFMTEDQRDQIFPGNVIKCNQKQIGTAFLASSSLSKKLPITLISDDDVLR